MKTIVKDGVFRTLEDNKAYEYLEHKGYRELTDAEKKQREPKKAVK